MLGHSLFISQKVHFEMTIYLFYDILQVQKLIKSIETKNPHSCRCGGSAFYKTVNTVTSLGQFMRTGNQCPDPRLT